MLHFESVTFQKWLNQFITMTSCPWFRLQTVLKGGQEVAHLIPWSESWWKQTNNHGGRNLWLMRHGDFLKKHCQTHLHQLQAPVCWPTWRCGCLCRATRWATCREPHPPGTTPGCWLSCRQTDMKVTSGEKLEVRCLFLKNFHLHTYKNQINWLLWNSLDGKLEISQHECLYAAWRRSPSLKRATQSSCCNIRECLQTITSWTVCVRRPVSLSWASSCVRFCSWAGRRSTAYWTASAEGKDWRS